MPATCSICKKSVACDCDAAGLSQTTAPCRLNQKAAVWVDFASPAWPLLMVSFGPTCTSSLPHLAGEMLDGPGGSGAWRSRPEGEAGMAERTPGLSNGATFIGPFCLPSCVETGTTRFRSQLYAPGR